MSPGIKHTSTLQRFFFETFSKNHKSQPVNFLWGTDEGLFSIYKEHTKNFNRNSKIGSWSQLPLIVCFCHLVTSYKHATAAGGHKASQLFVKGLLEFTQLDFGTHLFKCVGDLKRVSFGWYHSSDVSLLRFRINTLWVTILIELSASGSANPFHLTVDTRFVCSVAYASKGGRRAMHWL